MRYTNNDLPLKDCRNPENYKTASPQTTLVVFGQACREPEDAKVVQKGGQWYFVKRLLKSSLASAE